MSSTFSAESAVSPLALNDQGCEPLPFAKSSHSAAPSSRNIGLMSPAMTTSEPLPPNGSKQMEFPLILSAEDSPARTSATLEMELGLKASAAAYRVSTPGLLANYDRTTSSWKTSQRCLIEGFTEFSETWPRSGMMRNGIAYQLPTLAHPISAIGCGSLLTPIKMDGRMNQSLRDNYQRQDNHSYGSLSEQLISQLGCRNSPNLTAMIMGFPKNWVHMVTQSSRKSRKSSVVR